MRRVIKFCFSLAHFTLCALAFFTLYTLHFTLCYADTKQWGGTGDGISWEDKYNWMQPFDPTSSDDVVIDKEASSVLISKTFNAKSVTVAGSQVSALTAAEFIYGTIAPDSGSGNALYIRKDGSVTLKGAGVITLEGAFKNSEEVLPSEPSFMFAAE